MRTDLFIGITTWNSEMFLERCLRSIEKTCSGARVKVSIVDNISTDRSVEIARDHHVDVREIRCSQAIALNRLLADSTARYTLLIHADVVLLSEKWLDVCTSKLDDAVALVSPEDIGCGPLTRPYGAGMPESCFMLFDTAKALRTRSLRWSRRRGFPWPSLRLPLDHYYVTHDLPAALGRRGFSWYPMRVHASPAEHEPIYRPAFTPEYWSEELSYLRYAMGNFYSVDGEITHYHNWFDRVPRGMCATSLETTEGDGRGLPLAYLSIGTANFLRDYDLGTVRYPDVSEPARKPALTPRWVPDAGRPFPARVVQ